MDNARPSLAASERISLEAKYGKFRKSREAAVPFSPEAEASQKAMMDNMRKMQVALG